MCARDRALEYDASAMSTLRLLSVLALFCACGGSPAPVAPTPAPPAATTETPPPKPARPPGVKQYDAETLFKNVGVVAGGFSHDGSQALGSLDISGTVNISAGPPDA